MEIKINKEICGYNEALFFGLSTRQFLCSALAVAAAAGIYFGLKGIIGRETASWLCMVAAAPIAAMGFFRYNGLTAEKLLFAIIKSEIHTQKGGSIKRTITIWIYCIWSQGRR